MSESENNHSKSIGHKTLDESIIRRYIIPNLVFDQTMKNLRDIVISIKNI